MCLGLYRCRRLTVKQVGFNPAAFALTDDDEIRALRPEPNSMDVPDLDVVWDSLMMEENGMILPDTRPGAEGHAGKTGLLRPPFVEQRFYKSLRSQLADLACQRIITLT